MAGEGFTFSFALDGAAPAPASADAASPTAPKEKATGNFDFIENVAALMREEATQQLKSSVALTFSDAEPLLKVRNQAQTDEAIYDELERQGTDIIPGTYEGGLKLWECSLDLCRYIWKQRDHLKIEYVLELGCGHGLPGCLILRNGVQNDIPTNVLFADFNGFVLKDVTLPNILLNIGGLSIEKVANSVVFGAGDWLEMGRRLEEGQHDLPALPRDGRFDLLLAAETTYTAEASEDTALLLANHLAIDGVGLVATKRYYFGCGGGSDAFRKASATKQVSIEGTSYGLNIQTVEVYDCGSGNIRELLKVVLQVVL